MCMIVLLLCFTELYDERARGVAGLTCLPVTEEIAGSNPVEPDYFTPCLHNTKNTSLRGVF